MFALADMDGLDLLGAEDALASQYITIRIKRIDREKLKQQLGDSKGKIATGALSFVDLAPKAMLDVAIPFVKKEAVKYGVDVDVIVANAPPAPRRAMSEFFPGFVIGTGLGGASLAIYHLLKKLIGG